MQGINSCIDWVWLLQWINLIITKIYLLTLRKTKTSTTMISSIMEILKIRIKLILKIKMILLETILVTTQRVLTFKATQVTILVKVIWISNKIQVINRITILINSMISEDSPCLPRTIHKVAMKILHMT